MAIPDNATGYGNQNAANVFRLTFSDGGSGFTGLSSQPIWEAYDNSQTFPNRDEPGTAVTSPLFVGTTGNSNKPMICLVATTDDNQPGASWKPSSATAGSANPNRLNGTTNYVTDPYASTGSTPESITWNMVVEIPYDAEPSPQTDWEHVLQIKYTYTSGAPTLAWAYNDGTEGATNWVTMTPGTHGIRHCASGASAPNYYANIPYTSTEDTVEGWVTT